MALNFAHLFDESFRAARIANAPSGHVVRFGNAIDGKRAVVKFRFYFRNGREFEIVVDEMFIHIVGQNPHMRMAQKYIGKCAQFLFCIGRA